MARVRSSVASKRRKNRIIKQAKGYWGARHRLLKTAKEAVMHAGQYAYRDRRNRKRDMRRLWIARINAAGRSQGVRYSEFIDGLAKAGIAVNRKMLADMAVSDKEGFTRLLEMVRSSSE
jgi:large subunit ribosomal protein L20